MQDVQEDKAGELCKLTLELQVTKLEISAREQVLFVHACNAEPRLEMQNKLQLDKATYVSEQVAGAAVPSYHGLPGVPKSQGW